MNLIDRIKAGQVINELELEKDITKPWGAYITFARNTECTSKILIVTNELSVQAHQQRDEMWYLVAGRAAIYRGKIMDSVESTIANLEPTIVSPGDLLYIPRTTVHTAVNLGKSPAIFIETSLGHAQEDDIQRFYDKHGRAKLEGYPSGINIADLISLCKSRLNG